MIVYKATCKESNKSYIGVTRNTLYIRKSSHKSAALGNKRNTAFYYAIRKYGWDAFVWEIIEKCSDLSELFEKEIYYIKKYDTFMNGYNSTPGGDKPIPRPGKLNGMYGKTHSIEVREKLSLSKLGKTWEEVLGYERALEAKDKLIGHHLGTKRLPETIKKQKENAYWKDKGYLIIGQNNPNYGNRWTEDQKDLVRGKNNGMYGRGDLLAGEKNGMYNKKHTLEARQKMKEKQSKRKNKNYRQLDKKKINLIIEIFQRTGSIAKTAKQIGENYNKVKRELIFEGIVDKNFRQNKITI